VPRSCAPSPAVSASDLPAPGLGQIPGGYVLRVGSTVYRDLTLLDARATPRREDAWFDMPTAAESAHWARSTFK
jgi:hypothetical protein